MNIVSTKVSQYPPKARVGVQQQTKEGKDAYNHDCSAITTFLRAAFGLFSPARVCLRRRSSLTRCASTIVRLSCAALYTGFGKCRVLSSRFNEGHENTNEE